MALSHGTETYTSPTVTKVAHLLDAFGDNFAGTLFSSLSTIPEGSEVQLKIKAELCIGDSGSGIAETSQISQIHLGSIVINQLEVWEYLQDHPRSSRAITTIPMNSSNTENGNIASSASKFSSSSSDQFRDPQNELQHSHPFPNKRRKTTGALRVTNDSTIEHLNTLPTPPSSGTSTPRRLQTSPRGFPQRKKKTEDGVHHLQPASIDRFVGGIWKQIYSSVELGLISPETLELLPNPSGESNIEAFRAINSLCLKIAKLSNCSRAMETIIQAHWVDCFEARIKAIGVEQPHLSNTMTKMAALREACAVLQWSEKELRNKLAIWRGYKEIKDAGGWVSLIFAGSGIYRFCKYRVEFGKPLGATLGKLQASFEVAADTIHPGWRKLPAIIGQESVVQYEGHPHDWVVCYACQPVPLGDTYRQWFPDFRFRHLEDSVIDRNAWPDGDPRCVAGKESVFCVDCGYRQSNTVAVNECRCFPELYGGCKAPVPLQVFRTVEGKNNGVIARSEFPRGSAIGEFLGLITSGMAETDVMQSGKDEKQYQIYQGNMGNYTRFVNHSCAPNSQFQKFIWLGTERIVLVSRGIEAGCEITVDYSHEYWEGLDKVCLCGETCCRYTRR